MVATARHPSGQRFGRRYCHVCVPRLKDVVNRSRSVIWFSKCVFADSVAVVLCESYYAELYHGSTVAVSVLHDSTHCVFFVTGRFLGLDSRVSDFGSNPWLLVLSKRVTG